MRKAAIILIVLSLSSTLHSQTLSKSEKKELKKEIKSLLKSPEQYKALKENVEAKNSLINEQTNSIKDLQKQISKKDLTINQLNEEVKALGIVAQNSTNVLDNSGNKYRVQIGLYQNFDLTYLLNNPKFILHENVDELHRYSIGNFNTENEAETFKVEMRRLGLKDAFVTEYISGTRDLNYTSTKPKQTIQVKTGFNTSPTLKQESVSPNPSPIKAPESTKLNENNNSNFENKAENEAPNTPSTIYLDGAR